MRNTYPGLDGRSAWLSWWLSWRLGLLVGLTVVALLLLPSIALAADYVVQPGDTLTRIAARNGTTTGALAKANAITNPDRIYVGQRLRLPGSVPSPTPAKTPVPSAVSYVTVKSGDTLSRIAGQSGSTVSALVKANGLADADLIYVGQRLKVPTAKAPPSPTPPAKVGAYVIPVAGYRDFVPTHWKWKPRGGRPAREEGYAGVLGRVGASRRYRDHGDRRE